MDGRHIGILLPIFILTCSLCVIIRMSIMLHPPAKFCRNRTNVYRRTSDVISIFQDGGQGVENLLPGSGLVTAFVQMAKIYVHTKFGWDISNSQSTVEIKLLPVWESGRSPYRNSISCFKFDPCVVIGMWFCISVPNFVSIRRSPAELWRNIDFSRWRP